MKSFIATIPCALLIAALPGLAAAQAPKHHIIKTKAHHAAARKPVVEDDPVPQLTSAELETAKKVYVGDIPCELGQHVHIAADKVAGLFTLTDGKRHFRMQPVESRTGAIRLEDPKGGAVWIQLGNKSMLMNQKVGERLADECKSPEQVAMTAELLKHPVTSILDPLPKAQPANAAPAADAAAAAAAPAASAPK